MTLPQFLVVVSGLLMVWGGYGYLRDTLAGRTKPNRVSWSLWALAPLISLAQRLMRMPMFGRLSGC